MKQRKDGRYRKKIVLPDGKTKYVYDTDPRKLNVKVRDIQREAEAGIVVGDTTTVGDWAQTWFDEYKVNLRENTKAVYRNAYNNHVRDRLAPLPLKAVRPVHIQSVMKDVAELSESSQHKVLNTMEQIFETAIQNRLLSINPCGGIKITPHTDIGKTKVLSPEQQDTLMSSIKEPRARLFCALCLYAGLRREEALGLQWGDIKDGKLTINRAVTFVKNNEQDQDHSLKTKAAHRTVPIPAPLDDILNTTPRKEIFVVTTSHGGDMTYQSFVRLWDHVKKAVPFYIHPHMLRHSYATALYRAGIDLKTAQYLLGHTNIAVTAQIYTHVADEQIEVAGQKLESLFGDKGSKRGQIENGQK